MCLFRPALLRQSFCVRTSWHFFSVLSDGDPTAREHRIILHCNLFLLPDSYFYCCYLRKYQFGGKCANVAVYGYKCPSTSIKCTEGFSIDQWAKFHSYNIVSRRLAVWTITQLAIKIPARQWTPILRTLPAIYCVSFWRWPLKLEEALF